jgi:hypothetical protein
VPNPLDFNSLATNVTQAFTSKLAGQGSNIAQQFTDNLRSLARIGVTIAEGVANESISQQEAQLMLDSQRLALEVVAFGAAGQMKVALESAINSALDVIVTAVNGATGFALIRPTKAT